MPLQRSTGSPYDDLFAQNAGPIPQTFLRSLAYRESSLRPDMVHPTSHATGLFQITTSALTSFNDRQGSGFQLAHMVDPALNTKVAVDHLKSIVAVYRRYRSLQPDWTSRRWVELLVLGWNAGHNAVARLAAQLEASGLPNDRITVDTVGDLARSSGTAKYVGDAGRISWAKSVASLYLDNGGRIPTGGGRFTVLTAGVPDSGPLALVAAVAVVGSFWWFAHSMKKGR